MRPVDAKAVDVADVYKGTRLAGYLTKISEGVSFEYTHDYISGENDAVASTLPVREAPYVTGAGAVPAFFAGLLPEGARLHAVVAAVKTSPDDELSLLLAVGEDTVGDVRIVPHGERPAAGSQTLPTKSRDVSFVDMFAQSIDPLIAELDRALPGVQDKLSNAMMSFPMRGTKGPAILKLNPPAFPRIVENEAFCLGLARRAGLSVPKFEVIEDRDGVSGLLVERFDRRIVNGTVKRLAQEDACQLLNRWPPISTGSVSTILQIALWKWCHQLRLQSWTSLSKLHSAGSLAMGICTRRTTQCSGLKRSDWLSPLQSMTLFRQFPIRWTSIWR